MGNQGTASYRDGSVGGKPSPPWAVGPEAGDAGPTSRACFELAREEEMAAGEKRPPLLVPWWLSWETREDERALRGPSQRALRRDKLGFVQVDGEAPRSVLGIAISSDSRGTERGQYLNITVRLTRGLQGAQVLKKEEDGGRMTRSPWPRPRHCPEGCHPQKN